MYSPAFALAALAACSRLPYWYQPGVTPAITARDDEGCRAEAREATPRPVGRGSGRTGKVWVNHARYVACMRAKGYEWGNTSDAT